LAGYIYAAVHGLNSLSDSFTFLEFRAFLFVNIFFIISVIIITSFPYIASSDLYIHFVANSVDSGDQMFIEILIHFIP
jgi:hypothetical protein